MENHEINKKIKIQNKIENCLAKSGKALEIDKVIENINLDNDDYNTFFEVIREMESQGLLMYTKKGKIARPCDLGFACGTYINLKRSPYVECENENYIIPQNLRSGAMHGDYVLVKPFDDGGRKNGEILSVIKHNTDEVVGIYYKTAVGGKVICDNKKYDIPILIIRGRNMGANTGDRVLCKITHHSNDSAHKGVISAVFGNSDTRHANYKAILVVNNIRTEFQQDAIDLAEKIYNDGISPSEYEHRADLRDHNIFTIDSAESKDLDDAVSIEKTDNGYILGVHIADVSHYVRYKNPIDKEAFLRGTSVYFTDKVVPMLPAQLSNGICSLSEGVDRLAISVFMYIDTDGKVFDYSIKKSVINSKIKGVYSEINSIIEGNATEEIMEKYGMILPDIDLMYELAKLLKKNKEKRGAIDFDIPESKIILQGQRVADIVKRERGISDQIIEEFMLLCNETVARHMRYIDMPCIYRVHTPPNEEKTEALFKLLSLLGLNFKHNQNSEIHPKTLQKLLDDIKASDFESVLSTSVLRSMSKAIYSEECQGHFGLALKDYLHFTSPIRRYPDLFVHRILSYTLDDESQREKLNIKKMYKFAEKASKKSTECEIKAIEAERDITKLYMTIFMKDKIGEIFDATIVSVAEFGLFVQLDNTVEGLVHISDLDDDYYDFNPDLLSLKGQRKGKIYSLGQHIKVKLIKADVSTRQIDFVIIKSDV